MTGYASKYFRHSCPRDGCYYDQLPDWGDIIECFPRKIRPSDVDGMVEIGGHFLFLEEKRCGVGPDEGQRRALRALARLPGVTVAFFRPGKSSDLEVLIFDQSDPIGWQPCTRTDFLTWCHSWAINAEKTAS